MRSEKQSLSSSSDRVIGRSRRAPVATQMRATDGGATPGGSLPYLQARLGHWSPTRPSRSNPTTKAALKSARSSRALPSPSMRPSRARLAPLQPRFTPTDSPSWPRTGCSCSSRGRAISAGSTARPARSRGHSRTGGGCAWQGGGRVHRARGPPTICGARFAPGAPSPRSVPERRQQARAPRRSTSTYRLRGDGAAPGREQRRTVAIAPFAHGLDEVAKADVLRLE